MVEYEFSQWVSWSWTMEWQTSHSDPSDFANLTLLTVKFDETDGHSAPRKSSVFKQTTFLPFIQLIQMIHFKKNSIISSPISTSPNGSSELLDIGSTIATTSLPTLWKGLAKTHLSRKKKRIGNQVWMRICYTKNLFASFFKMRNWGPEVFPKMYILRSTSVFGGAKKSQAWKLPHSHFSQ